MIVASKGEGEGTWNIKTIMTTDITEQAGHGWNCNRTNPTPLVFANGTVLLGLRTTACGHADNAHCKNHLFNHCEHITLAKAEKGYQGPYAFKQEREWALEGNEDPDIHEAERGFFMVTHSKQACGLHNTDRVNTCGGLAFSLDGVHWNMSDVPFYTGQVQWRDGQEEALKLRQRPKVLMAKDKKTPLFLFTSAERWGNKPPGHIFTLAVPFNVPQNAHLRSSTSLDQKNHKSAPTSSPTMNKLPSPAPVFKHTPHNTRTHKATPEAHVPANIDLKGKPNFLIIHLDDVGYGDLSVYDQPTKADYQAPNPVTTHMNRMAKEGIRLTSFYSSSPVCTPSRAGLMTGRYPIRTSVFPGVFTPDSMSGLPHEEVTIASWMKKFGYKTMMAGKWHLGHLPPFLPPNHGFSQFTGMPWSHDFCPCPEKLTHTDDNTCRNFDPPCPR